MPLSKEELDGLMRLIGLTKDREINCEQCLALVSEFAEQSLAGKSIPDGLKAVEHHLSICAECREEYEALQLALKERWTSRTMQIAIKRIYDPPDDDGFRVLVDRLWPRGVKKDDARIELWAKELAPTTDLRRWFNHDATKFGEFRARYLEELESRTEEVRALFSAAKDQKITLLFAARDRSCNHAVILREYLSGFDA